MKASIDDTPFERIPGTPLKDEFQLYSQHGYADIEYGLRIVAQFPGKVGAHTRWACQDAADSIINAMRMGEALVNLEGKELKAKNLAELQSLFGDRMNHVGVFEQIPNEYGRPDDAWYVNMPWYKVYTKFGVIKLGWRKRVINIDWSGLVVTPGSKGLFPEVTTTVGDYYIHAHSLADGKAYINKILDFCLSCPKVLTPEDTKCNFTL